MTQESHHRAVVVELIWWRPLHAMSPQGVWYGIVDFEMALGRYPQVRHPLPIAAISQGKIPWNTPPWLGIEPGPQGGQTVSYPTELSWARPQGGQTVSYLTELSWPGPQRGQTMSYYFSSTRALIILFSEPPKPEACWISRSKKLCNEHTLNVIIVETWILMATHLF